MLPSFKLFYILHTIVKLLCISYFLSHFVVSIRKRSASHLSLLNTSPSTMFSILVCMQVLVLFWNKEYKLKQVNFFKWGKLIFSIWMFHWNESYQILSSPHLRNNKLETGKPLERQRVPCLSSVGPGGCSSLVLCTFTTFLAASTFFSLSNYSPRSPISFLPLTASSYS